MTHYEQPRILGGVNLSNMFILESGPYAHNGKSISLCTKAGFAAVSTETISLKNGYSPWWNIFRDGNNLYNCSKWSDIPLHQWLDEEIPFALSNGANVIATVGHTADEMRVIAPKLNNSGVSAIKACTYQADQIVAMVKEAVKKTSLPVWAKISANWPDYLQIAEECEHAGAQAIVAIDSIGPITYYQIDGSAALGSPDNSGWMSGECIHAKALQVISSLKNRISIPIIGTGGILDANGVRRAEAAGADAFGLCTAILLNGPQYLKTILYDLSSPISHTFPRTVSQGDVHLLVDTNACNRCGICIQHCGYLALCVDSSGVLQCNDKNCRRCGLCEQLCPQQAIQLTV